jgi:hypothetical protein
MATLIRVLGNWALTMDPERVRVINGSRLVVHASFDRHKAMKNALADLRRMADVGVYMNATLYEVERAFFIEQLAPMFPRNEDEDRQLLTVIDWSLAQKIRQGKLIVESDPVRLKPGQKGAVLSCHSPFQFLDFRQAGKPQPGFRLGDDPRPSKEGWDFFGTGLTGVAVEAKVLVNFERRQMLLHVTQNVSQLVSIATTKKLDPATGKEQSVQSPNVRRASLSGTLQVREFDVVAMPLAYRPANSGEKMWLMLARPLIWSNGEGPRKEGKKIAPKEAWDVPPETPEVLPPPAPSEGKSGQVRLETRDESPGCSATAPAAAAGPKAARIPERSTRRSNASSRRAGRSIGTTLWFAIGGERDSL